MDNYKKGREKGGNIFREKGRNINDIRKIKKQQSKKGTVTMLTTGSKML
jgi:hypothetical protein